MTEFEISGHTYRADKLPAFKQFHVSRHVALLIPPLIPIITRVARDGSGSLSAAEFAGMLSPLAKELSQMSDENAEYVIGTCLSVVKRKARDSWSSIWNESAKAPMFSDLNDIAALIPIVMRVLIDSLGPFIIATLTNPTAPDLSAA